MEDAEKKPDGVIFLKTFCWLGRLLLETKNTKAITADDKWNKL